MKVEHIKLGLDHQAMLSRIPERQPSATAVRLTNPNKHQSLLIVATYLSPNLDSKDLLRVFEEVEKVKKIQEHVIIGGDFNAHHMEFGSENTQLKGRIIKNFLNTAPYRILNTGKSTYTKNKAALDLTFSSMNAYNNLSGWKVLKPLNWKYVRIIGQLNLNSNFQTRSNQNQLRNGILMQTKAHGYSSKNMLKMTPGFGLSSQRKKTLEI